MQTLQTHCNMSHQQARPVACGEVNWNQVPGYPLINGESYTIGIFAIQFAFPTTACLVTYAVVGRVLRKRMNASQLHTLS
jgi:hypothetical protein